MDEIIIVALKNGQIMIGKPEYSNKDQANIILLISPRIIIMTGPEQIQLLEIFGAPNHVRLYDDPLYVGVATDKEMIRGYIQATTSLVMPN